MGIKTVKSHLLTLIEYPSFWEVACSEYLSSLWAVKRYVDSGGEEELLRYITFDEHTALLNEYLEGYKGG